MACSVKGEWASMPVFMCVYGCIVVEREARQLIVLHGDPAYVCIYVCTCICMYVCMYVYK